jgi:hypothetical protein
MENETEIELITGGSAKKTRVLVVDSDLDGRSSLAIQSLKEKFGDDIILVTPQQAIEQEIPLDDFANIPRMKITAPPIMPMMISGTPPTGKEKRRARRKQERSKARWR